MTAAARCYARTCGTCWTCTAAAEQVRAIADRRWAADWKPTLVMTSPPCWLTPSGQIVDAPADVQARALAEAELDEAPDSGADILNLLAAGAAELLFGGPCPSP
jgi:hypothetical protein